MARTSLRMLIERMNIGDSFRVPHGYEESTIRNQASKSGKTLSRDFSVVKNTATRAFVITRNSQ